jgi:hypothetical protein
MVKASNECGNSIFSSALEGEVFDKPAIFNLSGNGEYCEGSAGAVLTLSSSEPGVNYQLLLENIPFGAPIAGTGAAIEWINLTTTGFYTCQAASATCSLSMAGQIYVTSITVPAQPPAPTGNTQPCSNQPSVYIVPGTPANNAYIWQLTPSSAGELDPSANMVSVYWNQTFSGNATLTVTGENSCGQGEPSEALLIDVQATPNPVISGEQSVCVNDATPYQTEGTASNSYMWIVSGGVVHSGAGTNEVVVEWTTAGNGYLIVSETSAAGCMMSSQAFPVMVDPCIHIKGGEQIEYSVYPNPFTDWFNIGFGKKLQGENILVIYSSQGDVKKRVELPDNESGIHNIYAGELAAGIYSAVIYSDGKLIGSFRIAKR